MILYSNQVVVNLVEFTLPLNVKENIGKAIIVDINYEFFEVFKHTIKTEEVRSLIKKYQLDINNHYIEATINAHFLFYNSGDEYYCFSKIDNNKIHKPISEWNFILKHSTFWREDAFVESEKKNEEIINSIYEIQASSNNFKLEDIYSHNHILPDFTNLSNSKIFKINEFLFDENDKDEKYILDSTSNNIKLYPKDNK